MVDHQSAVVLLITFTSAPSSGESVDWDRNQGRLASMYGGRKNVPYLPDEEEEEDDVAEVEQGQERGKVTVRKLQ